MILIVIKLKQLIPQETRKALLEVTMEQAEARFNSKAFRKAMIKVNEILGYDKDTELELLKAACIRNIKDSISNDIPEKFKADALWWAISTFIETGKFGAVGSRKKALETFFQIKEAGKGSILSQRDINQIQSWDELEQVVEQAMDNLEGDKIYEDDDWRVFIPRDADSACKIGKDSGWCTSNDESVFNDYYSPEDPLIIFKSKKNPKDMYQLHYGTEEFMERKNMPVSIGLFIKLNDIVKSLADKLPENVIKLANKYISKRLEEGGFKVITPEGNFYINENGEKHRLDGPAYEGSDGFKQWWIEDEEYSEQGFKQKVKELKAQQNLREHFMRFM